MTWTCSNATILSHLHNSCLRHERRIMGEMKPQTNSITYVCGMRTFVNVWYLPFALLNSWALQSYYRHCYIPIVLPSLFSCRIACQCLSILLSSLSTLHQLRTTLQLQRIECLGLPWVDVLEQIWIIVTCRVLTSTIHTEICLLPELLNKTP